MMRLGRDFRFRLTHHRILYNEISDPSMDKEVHLPVKEIVTFACFGRLGRGIHLTHKFL
jgi:hypothetical protein